MSRRRTGLQLMAALVWLVPAALGCPSTVDTPPDPIDEDEDGSPVEDDCDDEDPEAFPGAVEVCDGVDNDCDDEIDEGFDADGDGVTYCGEDGVFPSHDDDCDDDDESVYPDGEEIPCDGLDNDCDDGTADEPDGDGDGTSVCEDCDDDDPVSNLLDEDGDGLTSCDGDCDDHDANMNMSDSDGDGLTSCDGDCDDQDPEANLNDDDGDGASPCEGDCDDDNAALNVDDVDEDGWDTCSGDCDDEEPSLTPEDADGDGYSSCLGDCNDADPTLTPEDLDGDGVSVCDGDCDDADAGTYPGAIEVTCDGIDNDCDAATGDEPDLDGDGASVCDDCDDTDATVYPGGTEVECDGIDNDCDAATPDSVDGDGDGHSHCVDCDDADAAVYPGALEIPCDGLDNDCDATTLDEPDMDGDGHDACADCDDGNAAIHPGVAEVTCDGADNDCDPTTPDEIDVDGDGYDGCAEDCDDDDAAVNPAAGEVCDAVDNNCDGAIDEGFDQDGDGYTSCGGQAVDPDCDDLDAERYPGAAEVCDGLDNDCDGVLPPDESDDDGDGASGCEGDCDDGDPGLDITDTDGDGWSSCDGDCDDNDAVVNPDAEEVCDDVDNDCDALIDEGFICPEISLADADGSWVGWLSGDGIADEVAIADVNGDDYDDLIVSAPDVDVAASNAGMVYVLYGGASPPPTDYNIAVGANASWVGESSNDEAGEGLAAGDLDNDGYADIVIGAPSAEADGNIGGEVYVVHGEALLFGTEQDLGTNAAASFHGTGNSDSMGNVLSVGGDFDGNGFPDLLIGVGMNDDAGDTMGKTYLIDGGPGFWTMDQAVEDASAASWVGDELYEMAGSGAAFAGDVNGDGHEDVLIGAPDSNISQPGAGRVCLMLGGPAQLGTDLALTTAADGMWLGDAWGDSLGSMVIGAGDVTGDGLDDFLLAAPHYSASSEGQVFLVEGRTTSWPAGTLVSSDATASWVGTQYTEMLGYNLAAGDFDDDGLNDVLIGSHNYESGVQQGRVFLEYGADASALVVPLGSLGSPSWVGEDAGDRAGNAVAMGDYNGDGLLDLVIGAYQSDDGGSGAGEVYLVFGQ